jgi:DNA-binding NarL/FixJ family response regulator
MQESLPAAEEDARRMGPAIRVLIAEDGVRARAALRALLSSWSEIEIVGEVANGQEAVDFVAKQRPDVVLMDIEMPGMDGLEATRRIKTRWPEIGIIVLTMYPSYRTEALVAGADGFISKTALPDAWLPVLRAVAARETP